MQRPAQHLPQSQAVVHGYLVQWCHPADEARTFSFHPQFLPKGLAADIANALGRCGLTVSIQPVFLKNPKLKFPGIQQASPTPIELKFCEVSDVCE